MTTTIVFATNGCYLQSSNATYSTARAGSGLTTATTSNLYYGQNHNSGYVMLQAFLRFPYTLPATERAVSAGVRLKHGSILGSGVTRDLEVRRFDWDGTVATTLWRNAANLAATPLLSFAEAVNGVGTSKFLALGSDELLAILSATTTFGVVLASSKERTGTAPTSDEGAWVYGTTGTVNDAALVYTSVPNYANTRVLAAQVQLSDGTWAVLESDGAAAPAITLRQISTAGVATTIATLPTGAGAAQFAVPMAAQALALLADSADNLYVLGGQGSSENTLAALRYAKAGATWTAGTFRTASMPAHSTAINQVAAAWHDIGGTGGTILVTIRHTGGTGAQIASAAFAMLNCGYLATGSGALLRDSGATTDGDSGITNPDTWVYLPPNDTGTGVDVAATSATQGVILSFAKHAALGEDAPTVTQWYALDSAGQFAGGDTGEYQELWGVKDAAAKARTIRISATEAVLISPDIDAGFGLSILSSQWFGTGSATPLGNAYLDAATASMPAAAAIAAGALWDAVYSPDDNKVWVYYFDTADARRLLRTGFSLDTYLPTGEVVQVAAAAVVSPATVKAIRAQRGSAIRRKGLVTVFGATGAGAPTTSYLVDNFNLPPNQPALVTRPSFDASTAAVLDWTFSDPNTGDTPTAYQVQVLNVSTGITVYDSTKLASANTEHTLPAATLANGGSYQFRVMTWDTSDAASPWSGYSAFTTAAGGTVTITSPATDNPAGAVEDTWTVTWTVAGTVQAAYRVRVVRTSDNVQLSDTGFVASTATAATITGLLSDVQYRIEVTVRNAAAVVSNMATRLLTASYGSPEKPQVTVTVTDPDDPAGGYIAISVTNPVPGSVNLGTSPATFDVDVAGYTPTDGTLVQSTAHPHTGAGSALLTTTGTPTQTYARQLQAGAVPVVAGRRYTARCWVYSPTARPTSLSIDWQDTGGGYLSTSSLQITPAAGVQTEIVVTGTAPVTGLALYGPTIAANPAAGTQLWFDDLILVDANDLPDVLANDIYRRVLGATSWQLVATVAPGGQFRDYGAADGVTYEYLVRGRAAAASRDADIQQGTLVLDGVWLHDPADPAGTARQFRFGKSARGTSLDVENAALQFAGRTWPVYDYGEQQTEAYSVRVDVDSRADVAALSAFGTARTTLMLRDNRGRRAFGTLAGFRTDDQDWGSQVSFTLNRVDYSEGAEVTL